MHISPLYITFGLYLLAMVGIGFWAWRSTRSFDDYILGGRSLGGYVTALAAGASDMSGWLLMGLPGALYASGLVESWIAIGLLIGAWLNWRFVAGPLRVYTEHSNNALTLPDYFTARFEEAKIPLRVISALVILVFFAIYAASGMVAGAQLFESVFGISYSKGLWLGAAATILYTMVGGFLAVSWTDTVQASLMIFALLLVPVVVILGLGGPAQGVQWLHQVSPTYLNWLGSGGVVAAISAAAWGLGYCGQPHILARFMAASSLKTIPQARRISITWMILCMSGAVAVGLFGAAYFTANPQLAGQVQENPERVFIVLAELLFNPWIAGVLLSAILAAVMSTLSAQLLICSSALTEDFYHGFIRPNAKQRELVWFGRLTVLAVALLAILLAQDPNARVLRLVADAWAGFGAAFGPVVVLSLFWRSMNGYGALAGVLTGALTVIGWIALSKINMTEASTTSIMHWLLPWVGKIYAIIPGFLFATIAIVVVSKLTGVTPSAAVLARHDAVHAELKKHGY